MSELLTNWAKFFVNEGAAYYNGRAFPYFYKFFLYRLNELSLYPWRCHASQIL